MKIIQFETRNGEVYYRFISTSGMPLCDWQFGGYNENEARINARTRFGEFLENQTPINESEENYQGDSDGTVSLD